MKNQRETALETFKAQSIKQDPISWHLWKRAFDEGVRYQEQLVKNNGVLGDVSVLLPTDEEITDWVCDEFKIDGLNFDEDVETQYGYLPEYFKSFAKWIISNER